MALQTLKLRHKALRNITFVLLSSAARTHIIYCLNSKKYMQRVSRQSALRIIYIQLTLNLISQTVWHDIWIVNLRVWQHKNTKTEMCVCVCVHADCSTERLSATRLLVSWIIARRQQEKYFPVFSRNQFFIHLFAALCVFACFVLAFAIC